MISYSESGPTTVVATDLPSDPNDSSRTNSVDPNGYDNGYVTEGLDLNEIRKGINLLLRGDIDPKRNDPKEVDPSHI